MANVQELKSVVKETLENRGVLGQIKARIRAEVFNALDDQTETPPQLSNENMIINELIREYLQFNKYKYTASVLTAESGQPKTPLDRHFLASELNIQEDRESAAVPLLYGLVHHFLSRGDSRSTDHVTRSKPHSTRDLDRQDDHPGSHEEPSHQPFVLRGGYR